MAKGKEVKDWITINGNHVPVYADGSLGGFMEGKAHVTKVGETTGGTFNIKEMNEKIAKEKADKEEADKKLSEEANKTFKPADKDIKRAAQAEILKDMGIDRDAALEMIQEKAKVSSERAEEMMDSMDVKKIKELAESKQNVKSRIANGNYDHSQGKNMDELESELKKNGLELDSADSHNMRNSKSFNDEKVTLYDKDGNEYEGTYNKYSDGGREVVDIKPKQKSETSFGKEFQDRVDTYTDKFLTKRSDKELDELKSNLEKGAQFTGTTEEDHVALTAIRQEQDRRKKRPDAVAVVSNKAKAPGKKEPVPETKEVLNARHAVRLEAQRPGGPNQKALETLQREYERAVEKAREEAKSIKVGDKKVAVNKTAIGSKYKDTSVSDLKQLAFDADLSSNEQYAARRELKNRGYVYEDGKWKKLKIKPGISQNSVY